MLVAVDEQTARVGRWFFRVIELDDGSWACRRGRSQLDTHTELSDALDHCTTVASMHRPAEVFVHFLDGVVRSAAVLDAPE